ncbi:protein-tyrosine phosphatase family protein [Pseudonocardia acaciae]|uniref:phosphatase domain-containing protein n=1 Tax=Pseudonocardia acaciae TaxID=551276 RepID=UPI000490EC37|nr:protein-tyrosine phosphatase family protein [Pseudonocardia acaciae]
MSDRLTGAITLPDGTAVRGRGRRASVPPGPHPTYGLYLGRPPDAPSGPISRLLRARARAHAWRPDWPADWIDWPDFRTPRDAPAAAGAIHHAYRLARSGQLVEVACGGGVGRTGTVIACMAVLAGHPAADAVAWTRSNYRPRAVETRAQRRWITWFATHHPE